MKYDIILSNRALKDIDFYKNAGLKSILRKIALLLIELEDHPYTGIGKPKQLKYNRSGYWSRRIDEKHRIIYQVNDDEIVVYVISVKGHYDDK